MWGIRVAGCEAAMTDTPETPQPADSTDADLVIQLRPRRWPVVVSSLFVVMIVAAFAATIIRVPYVIFSPGDATPVEGIVNIEDAKTYRSRGQILFLTVSVSSGRPNLWRYAWASNDPDSEVIGEADYLQGQSQKAVNREGVVQMDESQLLAKKVALETIGYSVTVTGSGARVIEVVPDGAASGSLKRDDVITSIDGVQVRLRDQVGEIVRAKPVGATLLFTLLRDGKTVTEAVTTREATSGELRGKPFIGIIATTEDLEVEFPVDVAIDPGQVTGPSAGLAFTLTIIDELTSGDLTGGNKIAVTGTIDADGNIGEVGGVPQKAAAARAAGATIMLVPRSEVGLARPTAGSMKVVGVDTIDEALKVLQRNGGRLVIPAAPAA